MIEAVDANTALNPERAFLLQHIGFNRTIGRAEGMYLTDDRGTRYLDALAQYGALPFGHNPAFLWDRLAEIRRAFEPSFVQPLFNPAAEALARALLALIPHMERVTFVNSGAEATEVAIKLARARTGRRKIVSVDRGFHGKTNAALCATADARYRAPFLVADASYSAVPFGDLSALERELQARDVAAFFVEPVQGEGGMRVQPPGYLATAQSLCRRHGTLLVLDEVQTGLGRTGALFGSQHHGSVEADVILLAKALGGGLVALGAVLCTAQAWSEAFGFLHSSTFANSHLSASVGLAALEALCAGDGALVHQAARCGRRLRAGLERVARAYPDAIEDVQGQGLMQGLTLRPWSGATSYFNAHATYHGYAVPIVAGYLLDQKRVLTAPTLNASNVLRVQPALIAEEQHIDRIVQAVEETVALIARQDFAQLFAAMVPPPTASPRIPVPTADTTSSDGTRRRRSVEVHPGHTQRRRFAFLMHPTDDDALFGTLPACVRTSGRDVREAWLRWLHSWSSRMYAPAPILHLEAIQSLTGAVVDGFLIGSPLTAERMLRLHVNARRALLHDYVNEARKVGAEMVGLGAYTSVISRGGRALLDAGLNLTTGNSLTAIASVETLLHHAARAGRKRWSTCAVVGASGAVGRLAALHLAAKGARHVTLVGNASNGVAFSTLKAVAEEVAAERDSRASAPPRVTVTTDVRSGLRDAELVLTATSAARAFIDRDSFMPGAIVCDVARPLDVRSRVAELREDVMVFEGGLMNMPSAVRFGERNILGHPEGVTLACLCETMVLALEGATGCHSIGQRIDYARALTIFEQAIRHGFTPWLGGARAQVPRAGAPGRDVRG